MKSPLLSLLFPITLFAQDVIPDLTEKPEQKELTEHKDTSDEKVIIQNEDLNSVTKSVTKTFQASGANSQVRNAIISMADLLHAQMRLALEEEAPKNSENVISILVQGKQGQAIKGSPYRFQYIQVADSNYNLKLYVHRTSGLDRKKLRRALMRVLIMERTLSKNGYPEGSKIISHNWFIDGFLEVLDWKNKVSDRAEYAKLRQSPELYDIKKLLDTKTSDIEQMDDATKKAYTAAAGGLVMSLLQQDGGLEGVKSMLEEIATYQGDSNDLLKRHFPQMSASKNGIRIAWLLQLSEMAMKPLTDSYTILETEKELDKALNFSYQNEEGENIDLNIENVEEIIGMKEEPRQQLMKLVAKKLVVLNNKAYPEYRPILFAYATAINALSAGKKDGVETMLANLSFDRKNRKQAALTARNYTDWYIVNHATEASADYSIFDKIEKQFENNNSSKSKTEMSKYLDVIERFTESK